MSSFQPVHFIPTGRKDHILASPILQILAIPHENLIITNHWCLYLVTSPTTSIQMDCQPSHTVPSTILHGGSKSNLVISELSTRTPHDAQTEFALGVKPGLTVGQVYDQIVQHGRHQYEFDSEGVGCRYWVTNQIDLLYQLRLVTDAAQAEAAKDGVRKLWPQQTPLPLDRGAYY